MGVGSLVFLSMYYCYFVLIDSNTANDIVDWTTQFHGGQRNSSKIKRDIEIGFSRARPVGPPRSSRIKHDLAFGRPQGFGGRLRRRACPDADEDYTSLAKRHPTPPASAGIVWSSNEGRLGEFLRDFASDVPAGPSAAGGAGGPHSEWTDRLWFRK